MDKSIEEVPVAPVPQEFHTIRVLPMEMQNSFFDVLDTLEDFAR